MQGDRYDWLLIQIDQVAEAVRKLAAALTDPRAEELEVIEAQTDGLLEDELVDHAAIDTLLVWDPPPVLGERHQALLAAIDRPD